MVLDCSSQGILLLAEATSSGSLHPPNGYHCLQMAGTSDAAAEVAMQLAEVRQDIQRYEKMLESCEGAQSRSATLNLINRAGAEQDCAAAEGGPPGRAG